MNCSIRVLELMAGEVTNSVEFAIRIFITIMDYDHIIINFAF